MKVVIQRVKEASVTINDTLKASVNKGLLLLLGIEVSDKQQDADWLAVKIVNLRIFPDSQGIMNLSLLESGGEVMVVSQFTLHASTKKGNRPSYIKAAGRSGNPFTIFYGKIEELYPAKAADRRIRGDDGCKACE